MFIPQDVYDHWADQLHAQRTAIKAAKRPVYTQGRANTVDNFIRAGELAGCTPKQAIALYLAKQIVSAMNLLQDATIADDEMDTRFADAMNYLEIGYVYWKEEQWRLQEQQRTAQTVPSKGGVVSIPQISTMPGALPRSSTTAPSGMAASGTGQSTSPSAWPLPTQSWSGPDHFTDEEWASLERLVDAPGWQ